LNFLIVYINKRIKIMKKLKNFTAQIRSLIILTQKIHSYSEIRFKTMTLLLQVVCIFKILKDNLVALIRLKFRMNLL
jgi:hypothetical protein